MYCQQLDLIDQQLALVAFLDGVYDESLEIFTKLFFRFLGLGLFVQRPGEQTENKEADGNHNDIRHFATILLRKYCLRQPLQLAFFCCRICAQSSGKAS